MLDVIIVGGGPAGLSAALVLGRARRRVLVCDDGRPRNARSQALHGFLTRDGLPPQDLLRLGCEQLSPYDSVECRRATVASVRAAGDHFEVTLADGASLRARKLVLATGVVDELPAVEGVEALFGRAVFHCPYCDGWEVRDEPLAALGRERAGYALALELTGWSADVVLCSDGPAGLDAKQRRRLERLGIALREQPIARVEEHGRDRPRIVFADGSHLDRRALFFPPCWKQRSQLARDLGCEITPSGTVATGDDECTCVPGVYVVGDASVVGGLAILAAAEGAKAAQALNGALLKEDLARKEQAFRQGH